MTNERLRTQIGQAGLSTAEFASRVGVDPKTVERWISKGRLPHRAHRVAAAEILSIDEAYLWPQVVDLPQTQAATQAEVVGLYPHRGAVPEQVWSSLIDRAVENIDILAYAGLFLVDTRPDLAETLSEKAAAGASTRILLGDPDSEAVGLRGTEEGIGEFLQSRIRLTLTYLLPAGAAGGVQIRSHSTVLYNSMYRFDDDLLVNSHAYGAPAPQNPVLHLRRVPGGRLFDHYVRSFERVWAGSTPIPAPDQQ